MKPLTDEERAEGVAAIYHVTAHILQREQYANYQQLSRVKELAQRAIEADEQLAAKDAEIERLRADNVSLHEAVEDCHTDYNDMSPSICHHCGRKSSMQHHPDCIVVKEHPGESLLAEMDALRAERQRDKARLEAVRFFCEENIKGIDAQAGAPDKYDQGWHRACKLMLERLDSIESEPSNE